MSSNARISVVIPSYNAEKFIAATIESLLAQTRKPDEIIVSDDVSKDRTVEIARAFGGVVKVLENPKNEGPGRRRNQGIRASTGDYIALMDADDLLEPDHLELLAGLLDRHADADVVFSRVQEFGDRQALWPLEEVCPTEPTWMYPMQIRNVAVIMTLMMRRKAFDDVGGFNDIVEFYNGRRVQAEDYDFTLRVSLDHKIIASRKPTYLHRWHSAQSSFNIVAQRVQQFKYRMALIDRMKRGEIHPEWLGLTEEKTRLCWAEWIERHWAERDLVGLRLMVDYGMEQPLLRDLTQPYRLKSRLPAWVSKALIRKR
jgi:glycosyltransferase involved in cell wall biosynthesis